jgi:hypothetical protein
LTPKKPICKRIAATGIEGTESNAIRTLRWQSLEPSDESSHHQVHPYKFDVHNYAFGKSLPTQLAEKIATVLGAVQSLFASMPCCKCLFAPAVGLPSSSAMVEIVHWSWESRSACSAQILSLDVGEIAPTLDPGRRPTIALLPQFAVGPALQRSHCCRHLREGLRGSPKRHSLVGGRSPHLQCRVWSGL